MNEIQKADWQSQIDLVKSMVAKNATADEFKLMSHIAVKYELDPLLKQIWLVKYGDQPASIFTGRDGFLSIAHRSGNMNGMTTTVERVDLPISAKKRRYNKFEKKWIELKVEREWQYKAICTIYRKDAQHPFIVEVYEEEYTTCENLWLDKPRTMLGKVAESQCLRKAFDISGLYSPEEMPEHHERDVTPQSDIEKAQAEFEKKNGINQAETVKAEPVKASVIDRTKRLPKDITDHFKALKMTVKQVEALIDANNDDAEMLRGWVHDNPIPKAEMVTDGEEGIPT